MADRNRREPDQTNAETEPFTPDLNTGWTAQDEQTLTEEELEHASMGWESEETEEAPSTLPEFDDYRDGDEGLLEEADGAVNAIVNREMRRNGLHTPGDDLNPGVDTDENAPRRDNLPDKKNGGSRGRSDFR